MFRTEHNLETGEIIQIPLTANEAKAVEKEWAAEAKRIADDETKAEAKETAKTAILNRIGLTADELKTILG